MRPALKNLKVYACLDRDPILRFSILVALVLSLSCCGKKAPPMPPGRSQPPTVDDLGARVDGDTLKLTWTVPREKGKVRSGVSGFMVYRSKMSPSGSDCKDCPLLFKRVAQMPVEAKGPGNLKKDSMTYYETLEKGYRYIYKVTSYSKGATGNDSNYVELIY